MTYCYWHIEGLICLSSIGYILHTYIINWQRYRAYVGPIWEANIDTRSYIGPILGTYCVAIFITGNYCRGNIGPFLVTDFNTRSNIGTMKGPMLLNRFYWLRMVRDRYWSFLDCQFLWNVKYSSNYGFILWDYIHY